MTIKKKVRKESAFKVGFFFLCPFYGTKYKRYYVWWL